MKHEENIREGEKIQIEIDKGDDNSQYLSRIEEIVDDRTFVISRPVGSDDYTYLVQGQVLKVMYFRQEALYYFDAEVVERIKSDESVSARISAISDKYKLQRRNYYRLRIMVPLTILTEEGKAKRIDTIDISGGGAKIVSRNLMEKHSKVYMKIEIPGVEDEIIKGRVVWSAPAQKDMKIFETAVEFVEISPAARQAIIRYIFAKQRELIKRGIK